MKEQVQIRNIKREHFSDEKCFATAYILTSVLHTKNGTV